jgi:hypothetical protein
MIRGVSFGIDLLGSGVLLPMKFRQILFSSSRGFYFCGVHPFALLIRILPKHIPTIATDNHYLFYSVCSQHVSAPTGHPQVNHKNIIYIFMKTIIPQHSRYFTIIHPHGVPLL